MRGETADGRDRSSTLGQVFRSSSLCGHRASIAPWLRDNATMTSGGDPVFKAFSDFGFDDIPAEAAVSRRMLRRLADIDNSTTPGPTTAAARDALASSVVAHAVVELENQLIELNQLAQVK